MKYLYKSLEIEVDAIRYDGSEESADELSTFISTLGNIVEKDFIIVRSRHASVVVNKGEWVVKCKDYGIWTQSHEQFQEKFESIRKMRVVRKYNKAILERRGRGFWGRVLAVQFGDNYLVLQNKRGAGRETAVMTYCDFEPTENEFYRLRQLFLKKYKCELGKLISFDQFCGAVQNGQQFYRDFEPVSKQTRLEL